MSKDIRKSLKLLENVNSEDSMIDDVIHKLSKEILENEYDKNDIYDVLKRFSEQHDLTVDTIEKNFRRLYGHHPKDHIDFIDRKNEFSDVEFDPENDDEDLNNDNYIDYLVKVAEKAQNQIQDMPIDVNTDAVLKDYADDYKVNFDNLKYVYQRVFIDNDEKLYEFLGMNKKPSKEELKKEAQDLALKLWREKGGNFSDIAKRAHLRIKNKYPNINISSMLRVKDIEKALNEKKQPKLSFKEFLENRKRK